jgi:hypothetical protein
VGWRRRAEEGGEVCLLYQVETAGIWGRDYTINIGDEVKEFRCRRKGMIGFF